MKSILLTKVLFLYFINNIVCQPTTDERHRMANYYGNLQHEMVHQQYLCCQEIESQKIGIQNLRINFTNQMRTVQKNNRDYIDHMSNNYTLELANLKGILFKQNQTIVALLKEISNNQNLKDETEKDSKSSIEHMMINFTNQMKTVQKSNRDYIDHISNNYMLEIANLKEEISNNQSLKDETEKDSKSSIENMMINFTNQMRTVQTSNRDYIDHMSNNYTLEIAYLKGALLKQNKTILALLKEISYQQNLKDKTENDTKTSIDHMMRNFTNQMRTVQKAYRDYKDQMSSNYTLGITHFKDILWKQNQTIIALLNEISNNQGLKEETENDTKNSIDHMVRNYTLEEVASLKESLVEQKKRIDTLEEISSNQSMQSKDKSNIYPVHKDCSTIYKSGYTMSGVYTIYVKSIEHPVLAYCDMQQGGGWTVLQRRLHGNVSFKQPWSAYKSGFGNVTGDFWLGNDIIAAMTGNGKSGYKLRVDLTKFSGESGYANYTNFKIGNEKEHYKLTVGNYTGTTGDNGQGLSNNNNYPFTTIDRDNDGWYSNCADPGTYGGGWWYTPSCGHVNLNGPYFNSRRNSNGDDIFWSAFDGFHSLRKTEMKFRPMDF